MFGIRVAARYLFAKKRHRAVNIISIISVTGVAVATAAIICVLSVFNGFSEISHQRLSILDPQLRISPAQGKDIDSIDSLCRELDKLPIIENVAPVIEERMFAIYNGQQMPVQIKAVTPEYNSTTSIDDAIIDGRFSIDTTDFYPHATISVGTAMNLGARPGYFDALILYAPRRVGRINPANTAAAFRTDTFIISGVFETGQKEIDDDKIIIPFESGSRLLDYENRATSLEITLNPGISISEAKKIITQTIGNTFIIQDRQQQQEHTFKIISIEKWITFAMLTFVLIIASFNVISTLSILIIEKSNDISTLRSLGASDKKISGIFSWLGCLISIIGGIIGTLLGLILCYAQQWGQFIKLNADPSQLSITSYPVLVKWSDILIVIAIVALVGLIISLTCGQYARRIAK